MNIYHLSLLTLSLAACGADRQPTSAVLDDASNITAIYDCGALNGHGGHPPLSFWWSEGHASFKGYGGDRDRETGGFTYSDREGKKILKVSGFKVGDARISVSLIDHVSPTPEWVESQTCYLKFMP